MNTPKILHTILNVILVLIIAALFISIIFSVLAIAGIELDFFATNINSLTDYTPDIYVFMILFLFVYIVFIYGLLHLKKVAKLFMANKIYDETSSTHITISGKCMVISGVFWWLFDGLSAIHFKNQISVSISEKTFVYLFIIAIGLFMLLMGTVFENTRRLKNENDLTI